MKHVKASIAVAFSTFTMPLPATPLSRSRTFSPTPKETPRPSRSYSAPPLLHQFAFSSCAFTCSRYFA